MSARLDRVLKVRVDEELELELARQAEASDRKPASLARNLIREGLELRRKAEAGKGRGGRG